MKQPLTIVLVLFCTTFFYAQNSNPVKLDSLLSWLDSHIKIPQDSKAAKNSNGAISLSKNLKNQDALAKACVFLVKELIPNAVKYAFPENVKGNILISLSQSTSETLTVKVADNGVGKVPKFKMLVALM